METVNGKLKYQRALTPAHYRQDEKEWEEILCCGESCCRNSLASIFHPAEVRA
jgi:hypothetical protein